LVLRNQKYDLADRLFKFAVDVIKCLRTIKTNEETRIIKYQLAISSSSSGANYEEAQGTTSKADFNNKVTISLKEMRESNYWLRICQSLGLGHKELCDNLVSESRELKNILGSITSKVSRSIKQNK